LKKVLDAWGVYLSSPESASVLGTDNESWFSPHGIKALEEVANAASGTSHTFDELFESDPKAEHRGYKSWDDFFTRKFRWDDGIRPVAEPENDDVIVNGCESKLYKVAHDVKEREKFWIKGQPYSVKDMLAFDDLSPQFIGGTIYQAFLSALSYHRWHSPVSGTVKKAYIVPGTYYSEPLYESFSTNSKDSGDAHGETTSQEYLTAVATRAVMFVESDNPKIGMVAFLGIGMTEVSTCEITVKEGQHVKKGDELG
jgi:phosphatidylserine decarboxylase